MVPNMVEIAQLQTYMQLGPVSDRVGQEGAERGGKRCGDTDHMGLQAGR